MNDKASPRPWEESIKSKGIILDANSAVIGQILIDTDRAYMLPAVNSHDRLVAENEQYGHIAKRFKDALESIANIKDGVSVKHARNIAKQALSESDC